MIRMRNLGMPASPTGKFAREKEDSKKGARPVIGDNLRNGARLRDRSISVSRTTEV